MFLSVGATTVIEGGQTMNPSTEDFLHAIERENAEHIFILPNNANIVMAAQQAKQLATVPITIIPSKTIPQGVHALFSFDEGIELAKNEKNMVEALAEVKTGLVTYATRDTMINGMEIKEGAFIGLNDDSIQVTNEHKLTTAQLLLDHLVTDDDEIMTIFYGADVTESELTLLKQFVDEKLDEDVEFEFHQGDQPIYSFIIMVE